MLNVPKDHHYIPQFYLNGFGILNKSNKKPAKLWVHSVGKDSRLSSAKNEAFEKELHTINSIEEEPDRTLEFDFAKIEGVHSNILRKILEHRGGQSLTFNERRLFADFVGLQIVRTPTYFSFFRGIVASFNEALKKAINGNLSDLEKISAKLSLGLGISENLNIEIYKKWLTDEKLQKHVHLMGIWKHASKYAQIIFDEMAWSFPMSIGNKKYCTCDDPVIRISKEGNRFREGIGKDTQIIFPLSSYLCFFADRDIRSSPPSVEEVNEKVVWQSYRFIYSQEENPGINRYLKEKKKIEKKIPRDEVLRALIDVNTKFN